MNQPQADMLDLYRAGLNSAADMLKASLEGAERLQHENLRAIEELMALQMKIARSQFEHGMSYCSNLCRTDEQSAPSPAPQSSAASSS